MDAATKPRSLAPVHHHHHHHHHKGTLIGCAPNNFMAANAGDHLSDLDSLADLYNVRMLLLGATVGAVALLPVYLKHRHERASAAAARKVG
jgi:hypothetical protein